MQGIVHGTRGDTQVERHFRLVEDRATIQALKAHMAANDGEIRPLTPVVASALRVLSPLPR